MSTKWKGAAMVALLATGVYACADRPASQSPAGPETVRAYGPQTCDTRALLAAARAYFSRPERDEAQDLVRAVDEACEGGDETGRVALSWELLGLVEAALENGVAGAVADGVALVNGLVDCIESTCTADPSNDLEVAGALGPRGIFAVRSDGTQAAIARGAVSFTFEGASNQALWGIEVDDDWSVVTNTDPVLVYGAPRNDGGAVVLDRGIGSIQYALHRYPDAGPFLDGALHVGACFATPVSLPHEDGDESKPAMAPRMQREAVLLEAHEPGFCDEAFPTVQAASVVGGAFATVASLLPSAWTAAFFTDIKAPSLGGTPLNFSDFAPVAAETAGTLEFVNQPPAVVVEGEPLGELRLRARSGGGTPMEKVTITLSIRTNFGVPAGAVLSGDLVEDTDEVAGVALFGEAGAELSLGKPGGYLVCATGELDGFTFAEVCSDPVHVRNSE